LNVVGHILEELEQERNKLLLKIVVQLERVLLKLAEKIGKPDMAEILVARFEL
jgi:hypothetical protein